MRTRWGCGRGRAGEAGPGGTRDKRATHFEAGEFGGPGHSTAAPRAPSLGVPLHSGSSRPHLHQTHTRAHGGGEPQRGKQRHDMRPLLGSACPRSACARGGTGRIRGANRHRQDKGKRKRGTAGHKHTHCRRSRRRGALWTSPQPAFGNRGLILTHRPPETFWGK